MAAVVGTIFVATFPAAVCCLPFEYVMIEIKKMQPDDKGKYPYTGYVDCAVKTLIAGGPLKFYTGFSVYCARIFPCVTVLVFASESARFSHSIIIMPKDEARGVVASFFKVLVLVEALLATLLVLVEALLATLLVLYAYVTD
ncbi:dicarboxylate carrier protein [Medicago truncatula]|uniref:Dicarboxylate carrier protein n=1 Tax=Medicago truncatula TaxID=3880 RepID=G7LJE7_MEDTR|nr:dicarboxylate carrier protein [Medicago truncatula]